MGRRFIVAGSHKSAFRFTPLKLKFSTFQEGKGIIYVLCSMLFCSSGTLDLSNVKNFKTLNKSELS